MANDQNRPRRLTINAAFLKDIKDDNRVLKQLMERIIPLVEHPQVATNHWQELVGLLADLRDQLAMHFALEEAYGYFDDAVVTAPQLSLAAECLKDQHPRLFERIRHLADRAGAVRPDDGSEPVRKVLADFTHFRAEFEKHEEEEFRLIFDALENDLGVGD
jgi:iron-sulfur cluster repair protein YtfE (RIC family)